MLKMIVCVDNNFGIGYKNKLPWNNKEEMEHFKQTTLNQVVVMGKNTYLSIGGLLPNRENIIFSNDESWKVEGAFVTNSVEYIINLSKTKPVWIIGGKQIYDLFAKHVHEIVISKLNETYECDTFFNKGILKRFYEVESEKRVFNSFTVHHYINGSNKILDGKKCSEYYLKKFIKEKNKLEKAYNENITLAIILIGNDFASNIYVNNKIEFAKNIGIEVKLIRLESCSESDLIKIISELNNDNNINGILVQLPLPGDIDVDKVSKKIHPLKDVDCFNPENFGNFVKAKNNDITPIPCTPLGILKLLEFYKIQIESKTIVILGRSNIVGKPLFHLLLKENATVTICHSKSKDLSDITKKADILISAIGVPNFINRSHIKHNSVLIDVGINRDENNILCGDMKSSSCLSKCQYITPVPGGIGPMTITMLFYNLLKLFRKQHEMKEEKLSS